MPFRVIRADITTLHTDAIVNAANECLQQGGGVCGAIFRAAGAQQLQAACNRIGHCPTGQAVITPGFALPAKYIIHTAGPVWQGGSAGEEDLLRSCYHSALTLAARKRLQSIAFPLISSGIYGYPRQEAIRVAAEAISAFLTDQHAPDLDVTLVLFDRCSYREGSSLYGRIASYLDETTPAYLRYQEERCIRRKEGIPDGISVTLNEKPAFPELPACMPSMVAPSAAPEPQKSTSSLANKLLNWTSMLNLRKEETFSQYLLRLIDLTGEKDATIYKRANVDRRLFCKIRSNPHYQPGKDTVLAFCLALHLSVEDAQALLGKAGYAMTHTSRLDLAVEYCLRNGIYDVHQINVALYELDLPLLGA